MRARDNVDRIMKTYPEISSHPMFNVELTQYTPIKNTCLMIRLDIIRGWLNPYCKGIFMYIAAHPESSYLPIKEMAKDLIVGPKTLLKHIETLIKIKFIERTEGESNFKANKAYYRHDPC